MMMMNFCMRPFASLNNQQRRAARALKDAHFSGLGIAITAAWPPSLIVLNTSVAYVAASSGLINLAVSAPHSTGSRTHLQNLPSVTKVGAGHTGSTALRCRNFFAPPVADATGNARAKRTHMRAALRDIAGNKRLG